MRQEIAGLVLAAGGGRRYGMPKALVAYEGKLLVERAAETLRDAGVALSVVVLGAEAPRVLAAATDLPATVINPEWPSGLGSSLRVG
ncbi:MAG TPA: NTP transferase domain-containing protein, partial [Actinoplanes sp.]|nr:NTP transferase domain-containing protein [Actinoplanes sp.]